MDFLPLQKKRKKQKPCLHSTIAFDQQLDELGRNTQALALVVIGYFGKAD